MEHLFSTESQPLPDFVFHIDETSTSGRLSRGTLTGSQGMMNLEEAIEHDKDENPPPPQALNSSMVHRTP